MKWSSPILCPHPLRDVRLAAPLDPATRQREREEQAYARGLEAGENRLREQLLQQRNELLELQNGVLQSLRHAALEVARDTENALLDLAFEVAQKVVAEIPISREIVEANLRAALAQVPEATRFLIHLHPDDLALLRQHGSDLLADPPAHQAMQFIPAPHLARGGCLVKTDFGLIDARRETRLELLRPAPTP